MIEICGRRFDSVLSGGPNADRLQGSGGNELFIGAQGADAMRGHGGIDFVDSGASAVGVRLTLEGGASRARRL